MAKEINKAEILLCIHMDELGLEYEKEFRFDPDRKWRADFFVPKENVLIEIEGGTGYFLNPKGRTIRGGRHNRQKGYEDDCIKYNTAQIKHGYTVLRFTTGMVMSGEAREFLSKNLIF